MSNTIESLSASLNATYPVFEPSQLLTSNHLNQLRNYLDTQDRMSRVKLVGIGIVCGLEVSYTAHTLTIKGGTGITSEGFLISIEGDDYTGCTTADYTDPQNYPLFLDPPNTGEDVIPIWELVAHDASESPDIEFSAVDFNDFVNDKVVVLFVEYNDIDLESCLGENCDDKGINREFTVRKLLVRCEDAHKIIHEAYGITVGPSSLDNAFNKRFTPEFLTMPSFTLISGDTPVSDYEMAYAEIDEYVDIDNRYMALYPNNAQNPLKKLADCVSTAYNVYKPLVGDITPQSYVNDLENLLKDQLAIYHTAGATQYFYDYSKDLIKAYNQFINEAFEMVSECCPAVGLFPRHLLLGKVTPGAGCPENENTCKPQLYRTHFIQSPIYNQQVEKLKEIRNLFQRFIVMTGELVTDYAEITELKVTPSNEKQANLDKRSIPFYYNSSSLYKYWNFNLTKRCRPNWNLGYHSSLFLPAIGASQNPLDFNMDPYNFYRIEAVLGKSYKNVVDQLEVLKRKHQLDFNILPLKLKLSGEFNPPNDCGLVDIKEMYLQVRNEFLVESKMLNSFLVKVYNIMSDVAGLFSGAVAAKPYGAAKTKAGATLDGAKKELFKDGFFIYINELRETLPLCIDDFNFELFHESYKKLTEFVLYLSLSLERLMRKVSIYGIFVEYIFERLLIADGYFGGLEDIYGQLKNNIDLRLWLIVVSYQRRKLALEKKFLFSNFAYKNPGLYHMAGVPRGGTYIIVYEEDGSDEVVADFALRGNACCCDDQFLFCQEEVTPYKPIARNVYYFITPEEYEKFDKVEIDVFESIVDINIKEAVLSDLLGKTSTEQGAKIDLIENEELGRKVIEYTIPDGKPRLLDQFEYRITHLDDGDMDDVGVVYVAVLPAITSIAGMAGGTGGSPTEDGKPDDGGVVDAGGDGTKPGGDDPTKVVTVWDLGKDHLTLTKVHTELIDEEENVAIDRYRETQVVYEEFVELGPLKEEPSAREITAREKIVVDKFKKMMGETVTSIEALDRQIGDPPKDARERMKYEYEMADKIATRDALVSLYVNQAETLGNLVVEEGLASNTKGTLTNYFEKEVKVQLDKLSTHTEAPKTRFYELSKTNGLDPNTQKLFNSL